MSGSNSCLNERHFNSSPEHLEDYSKAFNAFGTYCKQQLPTETFIEFTLTCFDISADQENAVLCGEYGNIMNFDINTSKPIREMMILASVPIRTVLFILDDKQIVISNDYFELYFIEFPSFEILYKAQMKQGPITIKPNLKDSQIFVAGLDCDVKIIKVSEEENYYTEHFKVDKIEAEEVVFTFDICDQGKLLALGLESGKVRLVSISPQSTLGESELYRFPPNHLVFSKNSSHLAASFQDFSIKLWTLSNNLILTHSEFHNSALITNLYFVSDNKYLLSTRFDGSIKLHNTQINSLPYTMSLSDNKILSAKPSPTNSLYYIQAPNSFLTWKIPEVPEIVEFRNSGSKIIKTLFIPHKNDLISISENGEIGIWDYKRLMMKNVKQLNQSIFDAKLMVNKECVICASEYNFFIWNYNDDSLLALKYSFSIVSFQVADNEEVIAVCDLYFRVNVLSFPGLERKLCLKGHLDVVTGCLFYQSDQFLFTCSKDCTIAKWDLNLGTQVAKMLGHESEVLHILLSQQNYLISGSKDGCILIWSEFCSLLYILTPPEPKPILRIYLSYYHEYLITLQSTSINYWKLDNLTLIFQTSVKNRATSFSLTNDEKMLAIAANDTVYLEENPLESHSFNIVGKNLKFIHKFMKFFLDSQNNSPDATYEPMFNQYVIVPYLIGSAHILAYCNKSPELNKALMNKNNRAAFFTTTQNESPLNVCVDFVYKNCIDVCLKFLKKESQGKKGKRKNLKAFVVLESCLDQLNIIDYPYISKLYEGLFVECCGFGDLPRFCKIEAGLPRINLAPQFVLDPFRMVDKEMFVNTGRPVSFYQSLLPLDLETGTTSSIDFLKSLLSCSDITIFRSKLLNEYLTYKWSRLKRPTYLLSFIYLLYLILLCMHILIFLESQIFLFILIQAHIFLVLYEVLQISTDFGDYWSSFWNIIDQLRSISFTIYALLAWKGTYNTDLLLSVLIFSWTRGIACFRIFDETRYMVRLIIQVIIDITSFFFILFYATLAFAFIYYMRDPSKSFPLYLTVAYRLDLGDFSTNFTSYFDWGIFMVATMINPLIMLNLLIAIMSDTATYVDSVDDIFGWRELTQMILDMEKVMFWKKHLKVKNFLHKVEFVEGGKETADKKNKKIAEIKRQVVNGNKIVRKIENECRRLDGIKMGEVLDGFRKGQEEIEERLSEGFSAGKRIALDINQKLKLAKEQGMKKMGDNRYRK